MGSKPLDQNFNAVVGKKVAKTTSDQNAERRRVQQQEANERQLVDDQIRHLKGQVIIKDGEVFLHKKACEDLAVENAMLRSEIAKMQAQLNSLSNKKTTGDVVTESNLKLRNKSSVGKKLPKSHN